jgi:hypothetical protein
MYRIFPGGKALMLLLVSLVAIIAGLIVFYSQPALTSAQDTTPPNFRTILEDLRARQVNDDSVIAIRFVIPLTPGEPSWIIGAPGRESARYIEYIGDDYLCFAEVGDPQTLIRCTPFSNIVNVDYVLSGE